jgi:hypothetical protein
MDDISSVDHLCDVHGSFQRPGAAGSLWPDDHLSKYIFQFHPPGVIRDHGGTDLETVFRQKL